MSKRPVKEPKDTAQQNETQRPTSKQKPKEQEFGEGNHKAGRAYDQAAAAFARSGKVEQAARAAAPDSAAEDAELKRAETEALARSKGEDPALHVKGLFQDLPKS